MTGGGDGAKPGVSWQLQVLSFSAFAVGNISLNYFNSWAVGETAVPDTAAAASRFLLLHDVPPRRRRRSPRCC